MKCNTHTNNKKKPENQIILIDFSYWYYKFNLLPIIGTMHPLLVKRLTPFLLNVSPPLC